MLVSVKLTPAEAELLDDAVEIMGFRSRSDAIRSALRVLWDTIDPDPDMRDRLRMERLGSPPRTRRRKEGA